MQDIKELATEKLLQVPYLLAELKECFQLKDSRTICAMLVTMEVAMGSLVRSCLSVLAKANFQAKCGYNNVGA